MTEVLPAPRTASLELLAALERVGGVADERGLNLPPDLPYEQYVSIGALLAIADEMISFYIADWLAYGTHTYGEKFEQAAEITGKSPRTLMNMQSVGLMIPPQRRRPLTVGFWHHYEVRNLKPADQKRILKQAQDEKLTKMQVRDLAREAKGQPIPRQELTEDFCPSCGRAY